MNYVKFKTLGIGQRFTWAGSATPLLKLSDTEAGETNQAGQVTRLERFGRNDLVSPAPAMVAHPTAVSLGVTAHIRTTQAQGLYRMAASMKADDLAARGAMTQTMDNVKGKA